MEYITVREYAELKGCKTQYIRKLCKDGEIQAEQRPHPQNNKMCYMIPITALPEEIQAKYYRNLKSNINLPVLNEEKKAVKEPKKTVSKSFEEMSEEERSEAMIWTGIIEEWLAVRGQYDNKAKADEMFVGKC